MRFVGYVRVSTVEAANDGLSLDIQAGAIRAFGASTGARLVRIYRDPGVSGTTLERPGLQSALEALERGRADALVVSRLDRLARTLTVQEAILAQVWARGCRVFTTDGEVLRDDPEDPMRTAMRQMVGVFSELERGMIAARLRAGRLAKAKNGGYAGGRPPYGWRADGEGALVRDQREQRAIRLARAARKRGESYRGIGEMLDSRGLRPRHGKTWDPGRLRRILSAEAKFA